MPSRHRIVRVDNERTYPRESGHRPSVLISSIDYMKIV